MPEICSEIAAVLAAAARVGPFFTVDVRPPGDGWLALDGPGPALIVDLTAQRLGTTERRVAASIFFQDLAARLVSPVLAGLDHGVVLDLDPAVTFVRLDPAGMQWRYAWVGLAASVTDAVIGRLGPVADRVATDGPVALPLLWGNVASSLVGTLRVLEAHTGESPAAARAVEGLLGSPPLAGTWQWTEGGFRRRSCCLFYRTAAGGYCGDCALLRDR